MHIPSYQIHNVLKFYSRQVSQSKIVERHKDLDKKPSVDTINISAEGKRKMIIDRVAAGIVDRITHIGPDEDHLPGVSRLQEGEAAPREMIKKEGNFIYNTIDEQNNKKTNTLTIEGANFVTQRLDPLIGDEIEPSVDA